MIACPQCHHMNPAGAQFCNKCGSPLSQMARTGFIPIGSLLNNRYRVLSKLGGGGMGFVYKATDTQLNRTVAVKEMRQSGLSPQELQKAADLFRQEAQLLASLHHANLPVIHDRFTENGRWYLVMDFIEGEDLETYLQKFPGKKLPVREVLRIGEQLCTVMEYLHSQRPPIIFRDLKPANIMITSRKTTFLIDFGIARLFTPGQTSDTLRAGSPGYAPPEQFGLAQTDARTDVYSLGATLHQMLTGRHPAVQPFNFPSVQSLCPDAPAELDQLIKRMVELLPGKRPANVSQVKSELMAIARQMDTPRAAPPTRPIPPPSPPVAPTPVVPQMRTPNPTFHETAWTSSFTGAFWGGVLACILTGIWQAANSQVFFTASGEFQFYAFFAILGALPVALIGCAIGLASNRWLSLGKAVGLFFVGALFCGVGTVVFFIVGIIVMGQLGQLGANSPDWTFWFVVFVGLAGYALGLWGDIALFKRIS